MLGTILLADYFFAFAGLDSWSVASAKRLPLRELEWPDFEPEWPDFELFPELELELEVETDEVLLDGVSSVEAATPELSCLGRDLNSFLR